MPSGGAPWTRTNPRFAQSAPNRTTRRTLRSRPEIIFGFAGGESRPAANGAGVGRAVVRYYRRFRYYPLQSRFRKMPPPLRQDEKSGQRVPNTKSATLPNRQTVTFMQLYAVCDRIGGAESQVASYRRHSARNVRLIRRRKRRSGPEMAGSSCEQTQRQTRLLPITGHRRPQTYKFKLPSLDSNQD